MEVVVRGTDVLVRACEALSTYRCCFSTGSCLHTAFPSCIGRAVLASHPAGNSGHSKMLGSGVPMGEIASSLEANSDWFWREVRQQYELNDNLNYSRCRYCFL